MMRRTEKRMRLCAVLLILLLIFIWGNSLMPGTVSAAFSQWVQRLFGLTSTGQSGHGLLRKLAHFTEFACLGAGFGWLYAMLGRKQWISLCNGFLAACVDETIQLFVPDRGPSVKDVLIDTAGVGVGIGLLILGHTIYTAARASKIGGHKR